MGGITVQVDDAAFQGTLRQARQALQRADTRELMRTVGEEVKTTTIERFRRGVSPQGDKWPVTIRQQLGDPRPPLLGEGSILARTYTYRADARKVEVGSNLKYAAIHHFGGTIRAKNAKALFFRIGGTLVMRKAVTIPARPALGLSAEDEKRLEETARDWLNMVLRDFARGGR